MENITFELVDDKIPSWVTIIRVKKFILICQTKNTIEFYKLTVESSLCAC